jgi:hypothetical protein
MQSAPDVPVNTSSFEVPMIGFIPLLRQNATGSKVCACPEPGNSTHAVTRAIINVVCFRMSVPPASLES